MAMQANWQGKAQQGNAKHMAKQAEAKQANCQGKQKGKASKVTRQSQLGNRLSKSKAKQKAEQWKEQGSENMSNPSGKASTLQKQTRVARQHERAVQEKNKQANVAMRAKKQITQHKDSKKTTAQKDRTRTAPKENNIWQHKDTQKHSKLTAPRDAKKNSKREAQGKHIRHMVLHMLHNQRKQMANANKKEEQARWQCKH